MTQQKIIYTDQDAYKKAMKDLNARLEMAEEIADVWNRQKLLPPMTAEIFSELMDGGARYLEDEVNRVFVEHMNKFHPGLGDAQPTKAKPEPPYNPERFSRFIQTTKRPMIGESRHIKPSLITFDKDGKPYISKAVKEKIKADCSAFETDENSKLFKASEALAEAANKARQAINDHMAASSIPVYHNPPLIDEHPNHTAGINGAVYWNGQKYEPNPQALNFGKHKN